MINTREGKGPRHSPHPTPGTSNASPSGAPRLSSPASSSRQRPPRRRRQWGHDRRSQPMPVVPPPINDRRIGLARLFIVFTVLAWSSYVVYWFFDDFLNQSQSTAVSRAEAIVYLLVVTLLSASSLAYLLCRLGFFYRAKAHRRATRAVLDEFYRKNRPSVTALVPSYQEDARVIRNTLLSVALQEYPDMQVVLLIDDPVVPRDQRARELLEAARALPGEIEELLSWPAARFAEALEHFEATTGPEEDVGREGVTALASQYDAAASWLENLAGSQDLVDHTDAFLANHVVRRLARDLAAVAGALRQAAEEGASLPRERAEQLYRRLACTFRAQVSSFERKRYVSLSHEPNKAMNLNSYIGLMGGDYREIKTTTGPALVAAQHDSASFSVRNPDYVLTLDADSILLPEYCLRLVHILEQAEHRGDAIAQTPYSAFPGSATRLERVAGATTDLQHLVHQGLTYYDATFWVGANAVIRKRALDDIVQTSYLGDWEVRTYIKDRTPIEDTDSTLDMRVHGWGLFNVPERLSYSATPPDFGSLCIQRQRWATGGMLIIPKVRQASRSSRARGERVRFAEKFLRANYMASVTWASLSLLVLLAFPFHAVLISPLLGLTALPYFWATASDLRYCGYKTFDIARVYGFNLLLVPINLAGAGATLVQAITASKGAFIRTPKVRNRTVTPLTFVITPYLLVLLAAFTCFEAYRHRIWEDVAYAALNLALAGYGIVAFIGLGNSLIDSLTHLRSFVFRAQAPKAQQRWARRSTQPVPVMVDWRSVLDLGTPATGELPPGLRAGAARQGAGQFWQFPGPNELLTVFQPVVDLSTGQVVGHEALTRFDGGASAEHWLAEAVAAGEGAALEAMMARSAIAASAGLPPEGWLAIKVSPRLLHSDADLRYLLSSLNRPVLVELTEPSTSDVLPDLREVRSVLPPKALIAVEHAGLGHKTLSVLLELRPAYLKLDRSVMEGMVEDGQRHVQLANLAKVARECGCSVVVTGVETDEQRQLVSRLGASLAQGFLFGRPEPFAQPGADVDLAANVTFARAPSLAAINEDEPRRYRLSPARALAALAVMAVGVYAVGVKLPQAVQAAEAPTSPTWFAPYVDATLTPAYPFQDRSQDTARQVVLGFVVSSPRSACTPSWGGYYTLPQAQQALAIGSRLAELQQEGVGAIISFGGRDNTDLAVACHGTVGLERAYQSVLSTYHVNTLDLDVEGAALSDAIASQRRAVAVAALQSDARRRHEALHVWLTLPAEPDGLQPNALAVVNAMLRARVQLSGVNIMAMDFSAGYSAGSDMLSLSEQAAAESHQQLRADFKRYGISLTSRQVWQRMGVTVMIGQNDVAGQVFTLADAQGLARFATNNDLARVSMWSLNRDSQCGQGFDVTGLLSNSCSGTAQGQLGFSTAFSRLDGLVPGMATGAAITVPAPDTNPADALYPLWSPTAEYEAGYKVVRDGYIYQAKWYNAAEDPAQVWPNAYQSPWQLVGPVLPTDRAPRLPTLPAGTYPAWSPHVGYEAGAKVLYQGLPYQAKWYTQGDSPGEEVANPFGSPWQPLYRWPGEPAAS